MNPLTIATGLDLNDNGRVAWPDFLGWTFLTAFGVVGAAAVALVALMILVGATRVVQSVTQVVVTAAHHLGSWGSRGIRKGMART